MLSKQLHALNIAIKMCAQVGSPYAKRARFEFSNQCFGIPMPNPDAYDSAMTFAKDYAIYAYMRKYEGAGDVKSLESKAIIGFKETESRMSDYNRKIGRASCRERV